MATKNITLKKLGKRFVATILAVAMIVSTITIQSANNIVGAEETAKSTDGYVIENTTNNTIKVVIKHILNGKEIYSADNKELTGYGKINNYKKAVNYNVESVKVDDKTLTSSNQWSKIGISSSATIQVNYRAISKENAGNSVAFYDYDVQPSSDKLNNSINRNANYNSNDTSGRFTVGQESQNYAQKWTQYEGWVQDWFNNDNTYVGSENSNIDSAKNNNNQYINRYAGLKETDNNNLSTVVTGIVKGLDRDGNVVFNFNEPGVFTNEEKVGKKVYNNGEYTLNFKQVGDTYTLFGVENRAGIGQAWTVAGGGQRNQFLPLPLTRTENAEGGKDGRNFFFGMRYDVEFKLGDYIGDLDYKFSGDDDMWVLLDGNVVLDLGGIHSVATGEINLWNFLGENPDRNSTHKLTVLYMERGAYESNCEMKFTLPNARVINATPTPKTDITINKLSSSDNTLLSGAQFTLTNDSNSNDTVTYYTDSNGKIKFTNLVAGTYTLREVSAPDGYQITDGTYKIKVTNNPGGETATAKLYKEDGQTLVTKNKIYNTPIEITTDNLQTDKTAKLLDWDKRTYQVDLYAAHNIMPANKALNLALMLDFSGSMPWFVTKPTGGTIKYSHLNTKANRNVYTLRTGGSEGVSAWSGYKYYVLRDGEGSSKEYKPVAYLTSTEAGKDKDGWYAIASGSNGSKGKQTVVDRNETIYVRGANDQTKLEALQTAITNFIENLKVVSPNSKVAIIPYAGKIITDAPNTNKFISIDSVNVKEIFSKIKLYGGTQQELAINKATELLRNNDDKENTYGILFSDGDRSGGNEAIVTNAANELKKKVSLLFTAGIFGDSKSSGAKNMNTWASSDPDDGSKKLVYIRDTANDLIDAFSDIFGYITVQLKDVTITDYIDERFDITDENGNKLEITEGQEIDFAGGKVGRDDKGVYIRWDNVTLSYAQDLQYGWHRTIYVKAKDDYIGGNNVKTNIDNISNVKLPDNTTKPFDTPTVNVKIKILVGDLSDVLFKGETYSVNDIIPKMFEVNGLNPNYQDVDLTKFVYKWYSDSVLTNEVTLSDIKEDATYYLKVIYNNVATPTEQSNQNTTLDSVTYSNDSNGVQALNKNDEKLNYGKLDIKFVAGRLAITKEIDSQYTDEFTASKTNATQTFVFKVEQYANKEAYDRNEPALKTLYETITFNANEQDTRKTKFISELEKGYYVVTEETSWSSKYSIDDSTAKVQEFNIGNTESTDDNGKKTFTGLDDNENCKYTELADGTAAGFCFKNILKPWANWYSDAATAKNKFNK